ncbi:hypothetical protein GCM10009557_45460 [Virgisporangium ochraceum]
MVALGAVETQDVAGRQLVDEEQGWAHRLILQGRPEGRRPPPARLASTGTSTIAPTTLPRESAPTGRPRDDRNPAASTGRPGRVAAPVPRVPALAAVGLTLVLLANKVAHMLGEQGVYSKQ